MNLKFLGTRGEIEKRTRRHHMHTSVMVSYRGADVMIDCGLDLAGKIRAAASKGDCADARAPRSRLGFEKRRTLPGARAAKNLGHVNKVPNRGSASD